MIDKTINYDDAIVAEINNKDFTLTINANSFSDEFYTVDYINSIFDSLRNCCNVCNTIIRETDNYFKGIDEIGETKQPDLINLELILNGEATAVDNAIITSSNNTNTSPLPNMSNNTSTNVSNSQTIINGITASGLPNMSNNSTNNSNGNGSNKPSNSNNNSNSTNSNNNSINIKENKIIDAKITLNNGEYLNIFVDSNNNSSPIATITNGSEIKVIGEDNNMYKIIYGENLDKIGYVSKDYVNLISNDNSSSTNILDAKVVTNSNELLRIYQTSNLETSVNEILGNGSCVKIIGEDNNMYKIIYGDNFNKIGYASKNYIQ